MEEYLFNVERIYYEAHGHSMDYKDMLSAMEDFRREDCLTYIKFRAEQDRSNDPEVAGSGYISSFVKHPKFHFSFYPKKVSCKDWE
jgi:hypothetical protein